MTERINGHDIFFAFLAGAQQVSNYREYLNSINVFPVRDSDTGNNLSSTLTYIVEEVRPTQSAGETLRLLADASLSGARGNSGIIVAQFINGISREIQDQEEISPGELGRSIRNAIPHAYSAMDRPVEGTILTVLRDWAEAFAEACQKTSDLPRIFADSLGKARESLAGTPEKLQVLKEANVVDAGAQGLIHFLEGITALFHTRNIRSLLRANKGTIVYEDIHEPGSEDFTWRYCCEALIIGEGISHPQLKEELAGLGSSMIVAGNPKKTKIHLHANDPGKLFMALRKYGMITQQKVDDMKNQYDLVHNRRHTIGLITDSIADLPPEFVEDHQIQVIPINLQIEGSNFLDKRTISPQQLFSLLDGLEQYPTSSQPSVKAVRQTLEFMKDKFDSVIMITVSRELSGTWNVFQTCAEELQREGYPVSVVDSRLNSGAQGLLVMEAAEMIGAGMGHSEIVQALEEKIARTKIYVSVSDFSYMVRGGRVSPLKGRVAKVLNLKPIISLDEKGKGTAFASALSQKGNLKKIREIARKTQEEKGIARYAIVHANAEERAEEYREIFTRMFGREPAFIQEISTVVALSAGLGAVALCLMEE